jgi:hypothetical protein
MFRANITSVSFIFNLRIFKHHLHSYTIPTPTFTTTSTLIPTHTPTRTLTRTSTSADVYVGPYSFSV